MLGKVKVRTPQGVRKVTFFETLLIKERELAIQGDWRARKTMLEIGRWSMPEDVVEDLGVSLAEPSEADRAVLEWFEAELRERDRQGRRRGTRTRQHGRFGTDPASAETVALARERLLPMVILSFAVLNPTKPPLKPSCTFAP